MKYLLRPEPIEAGGTQFSLDGFVAWLLDHDAAFNRDGAGIRSAWRIEQSFRATAEGRVPLEDADHARLAKAAANPSTIQSPANPHGTSYPLVPARRCVGFLDAIERAGDSPE